MNTSSTPSVTVEQAKAAIFKRRFPYVKMQDINRPVTVHWFDVVKAIDEAAALAATSGKGSGLPDYEAHARERQAKALYFLEPIPSPAHQQWAPFYLDWDDLRDEQKRIYYRRGAVAAERMDALTPTHPNDMARENERLREALKHIHDYNIHKDLDFTNSQWAMTYAQAVVGMRAIAREVLSTTPSNPPSRMEDLGDGRWVDIGPSDQSAPSGGVRSEEQQSAIDYATRWLADVDRHMKIATPFPRETMRLLLAALTSPAGEGGVLREPTHPTFNLGDRVEKWKGAAWRGRVVGTYSSSLIPEGYVVESENEFGSVRIHPVQALRVALSATEIGNENDA